MNKNLDFLRAFAVLCVLCDHLVLAFQTKPAEWPNTLGRLGVLLFFVHTSLVLMQSLERHARQAGWAGRFYLRRIFRIYPLASVCFALALWLHIPSQPRGPFVMHSGVNILCNFLLIQNLLPHDFHSILAPAWSLPYEVQMYLLLPGIFVLLMSGSNRKRWLWLAGLVALSLALARLNYDWPKGIEVMSFFPCFMGGVVAWQTQKYVRPRLPAWSWQMAFVALAGLFLFLMTARGDSRLEWLLCLVLGALIPWFRQISHPWLAHTSEQIAKYSYGVYLVHEPLIWLVFVRLGFSRISGAVLYGLLLVAVPVALYRWVEHPMIVVGARLTDVKVAGQHEGCPGKSEAVVSSRSGGAVCE